MSQQREATKDTNITLKSKKQADQFSSQYFLCSHAGILRGKWHQAQKYHLQYSLQLTIHESEMHSVPGLSCSISIQNNLSKLCEGKGSTVEITVQEILSVLHFWMPYELLEPNPEHSFQLMCIKYYMAAMPKSASLTCFLLTRDG